MKKKSALALLVLAGCATNLHAATQPQASQENFELEPCHIKGVDELAQCAILNIPENHKAPDGKTIDIHVTLLPPSGGQPDKEPLYFLAGGPGQGASELGDFYDLVLRQARRGRELVLIDQRGTGRSKPFSCQLSQNPLESGDSIARACLADNDHDPRYYTSAEFIQDIDVVRQTLGHEEISLMGISYGTRAALLYAKNHEQYVRAMVLDSVAPPHVPAYINDAKYAGDTLNNVVDNCLLTKDCSAAFPNLKNDLATLLDNLDVTPKSLGVLEGDGFELTINKELFLSGFRNPLYAPHAARIIPFIIDQAKQDNFDPWLALTDFGNQENNGGVAMGLFLSVQCAEEIPTLKTREDEIAQSVFPGAYQSFLKDACSVWPIGDVPADYNAPVKVATPTLLLSGSLDPITPPVLGAAAAEHLPNSKHIVINNVGHSITGNGCSDKVIAEFLDHGDLEKIDADCLNNISRPAYVVGRFGPNP